MSGHKIIEGLKQALAGDFAAVTIEGQRWMRSDVAEQRNSKLVAALKFYARGCNDYGDKARAAIAENEI